ncbi:MAG TPA: alpha-galactosidase [Opitutaceae bacterium]|nr:alpha-galactosidase [Opitutaceae bacterium]HND60626.1 alpha-galactosidase [Opitutaceae bacterium]
MQLRLLGWCVGLVTLTAAAAPSGFVAATPAAPADEASAWFEVFRQAPATHAPLPFSFVYGGHPASELLAQWGGQVAERRIDDQRREVTLTFTDPASKLEVRCVAVAYADFPVVEWTVYFRNGGTAPTPILEQVRSLDANWTRAGTEEFLFHHSLGTFFPFSATDFMPQQTKLEPGQSLKLIPLLGRPSGAVMPYFNLERAHDTGVIFAVGWPGAWVTELKRDDQTAVHVAAGQELVHARLEPGEEIRSPLMALLFWRGDWIDGQNAWRRWMLAHNLPKPFGQPHRPLLMPSSSEQFDVMIHADEANQLTFIDRYLEEKLPIDAWWMDAGWYENAGRWQEPLGLRVDRKRFPRGLRAITDHAHAHGLKTLLWFEPERIMPTNELFRDHPDWLLPNRMTARLSKLFYLGNPAAHEWVTDRIVRILDEEGIDVYRNDFNVVEPVELWRSNDTPDRQGITENHHVVGYLKLYDELRRRHPGLVIDSCAGGGSRDDLETMRRALPFYRSDYLYDVVSNQSQSYGFTLWIPFHGTCTGVKQFSTYELRSNLSCPVVLPSWDLRDRTLPYDLLRQTIREWQEYSPSYFGDFYPLTPDSLGNDVWIAWQFNRPEAGRGVVQAFRRAGSIYEQAHVNLRGLDPTAHYRVRDLDAPGADREFTGQVLMMSGLTLAISSRPGTAILVYERLPKASTSSN